MNRTGKTLLKTEPPEQIVCMEKPHSMKTICNRLSASCNSYGRRKSPLKSTVLHSTSCTSPQEGLWLQNCRIHMCLLEYLYSRDQGFHIVCVCVCTYKGEFGISSCNIALILPSTGVPRRGVQAALDRRGGVWCG